jgi:hypothetical protein
VGMIVDWLFAVVAFGVYGLVLVGFYRGSAK